MYLQVYIALGCLDGGVAENTSDDVKRDSNVDQRASARVAQVVKIDIGPRLLTSTAKSLLQPLKIDLQRHISQPRPKRRDDLAQAFFPFLCVAGADA